MTPEQRARLPKFAREHIDDMERQRNAARAALKDAIDAQTPAPFYADDIITDERPPRFIRRYFQGHRITVDHIGVRLDVNLRDDCIDLQWSRVGRMSGAVNMQPRSYQQVHLIPIGDKS